MAKQRSKKNANGNANGAEAAGAVTAEPIVTAAPVDTASAGSEPVGTDNKATVRKSLRKPEIVKTESRSNLVPINLEEEIRRLAYLISERRGFEPGHETEDWLNAEHEVLTRYQHPQETATA